MAITAEAMVKRRTGASNDDVAYYVELADARIRAFLGLPNDADLTPYMLQEADIAVLYYQRDTSEQNTGASLGYTSESFSEGQMSESHAIMNGSIISANYETAILQVLQSIGEDEATTGLAVMY